MKPAKNCLKHLSICAIAVSSPLLCSGDDLGVFSIDPGTSGSAPTVTVKEGAGQSWNAFYYKLQRGEGELLTSSTRQSTSEPLTFKLPPVESDTHMEVVVTTDTELSTGGFRWRTLARPEGQKIMDYRGQKEMLPPEDFDAFWARAKKELDAVAVNERITREPDQDTSTGLLYKVELDSVENTTIVGWYYVPRDAYKNGDPDGEVVKKFPAIIITPGYGAAEPPIDRTTEGYITFSTNPRNHGPSKAYWKSPVEHLVYNIDQPESYYYKLGALDCLQAARFVLKRAEVDPERVATEGGSQGGYFAVATAALEPRIRCVVANIIAFTNYPDGMDMASKGHHTTFCDLLSDPQTSTKLVMQSLAYTDGLNLITRVKAPVQISMGGVDPVCPYICGVVAYNRLPKGVEKDFRIYPTASHQVPNEMRAGNRQWYDRWLKPVKAEQD